MMMTSLYASEKNQKYEENAESTTSEKLVCAAQKWPNIYVVADIIWFPSESQILFSSIWLSSETSKLPLCTVQYCGRPYTWGGRHFQSPGNFYFFWWTAQTHLLRTITTRSYVHKMTQLSENASIQISTFIPTNLICVDKTKFKS